MLFHCQCLRLYVTLCFSNYCIKYEQDYLTPLCPQGTLKSIDLKVPSEYKGLNK